MIYPKYDEFLKFYDLKQSQIIYKRLPADLDTAVSLMIKLTANKKNSFLLESVTGGEIRGRYSIIGMDPDLVWECYGEKSKVNRGIKQDKKTFKKCEDPPLIALRKIIAESSIEIPKHLPEMSAGIFGFIGYDMIRLVENLPHINKDNLKLPDSVMIRPTVTIIIDGVKGDIIIVSPVWHTKGSQDQPSKKYDAACQIINEVVANMEESKPFRKAPATFKPKTLKANSNISKKDYIESIIKAKKYIRDGEIFQVVPSQRWSIPFDLPPFSLYRALRRTNPSPYMFFFNFGDYQIVGASPEILVKVKNNKVTIRPIAGTRPRGSTYEKDKQLEKDLLSDKKELAEHLMLLDLGRNDTSKVCKAGTVIPTEQFIIEKYSHVMHIVSNVEGELDQNHDALSALLSGLPAGTVSGAPKVRAMEIIDELETEKRGIYGGGIGYFGADGEMDICIALRTGIIKNKTLFIQAGGGVVHDSDPQTEYEETINKSKALLIAAEESINFTNL